MRSGAAAAAAHEPGKFRDGNSCILVTQGPIDFYIKIIKFTLSIVNQ